MRFTASVNYLDASDDQGSLAAGASDFLIKVRHLVDEGDAGRTVSLTGHEAPVLCVKFDPVGKFLVWRRCFGGLLAGKFWRSVLVGKFCLGRRCFNGLYWWEV